MVLIFFRLEGVEEFFYPIEIPPELMVNRTIKQVAAENAELNPGTLRVENISGDVLWPTTH